MSPEQARSARAFLNMTLKDVEKDTQIKVYSISRFENEQGKLSSDNAKILEHYYKKKGVEFTNKNGIQPVEASTVIQLEGQLGFFEFMEDVADTIDKTGGEICVSGVDELLFEKWQGNRAEAYLSRMARIRKKNNFISKIIVKQGDYYYTASAYAEYRHINEEYFASTPFYVYGDKLSMITFDENNVTIYTIENKKLADAQRKHFNSVWETLRNEQ
ncbi:MAG: helix-turn-helix transcriptional regulator [Alphaproteobacteria bacterium]|nr:helix-turn-helix transcriptional regulator [Alphaproteobacteria bacterium]